MKEIFEDVYYNAEDIFHDIIDFSKMMYEGSIRLLLFITIPIWLLPYKIYKKRKDENAKLQTKNE